MYFTFMFCVYSFINDMLKSKRNIKNFALYVTCWTFFCIPDSFVIEEFAQCHFFLPDSSTLSNFVH